MPSGSSPFTGSSNISTDGSPSSAAAMPSRCFMPREKPRTRLPATLSKPVIPSASATRCLPMPLLLAMHHRWLWALRPPCTAFASSSAPTSCNGQISWPYRRPCTLTSPALGASRPRIVRIVVDLPAPFGPRNPVTLPGSTSKLRSSTATVAP